MRSSRRSQVLACVSTILLSIPAMAQSGTDLSVLYQLQPGSAYEEGCYGECMCPVFQAPLSGTFGLTLLPTGSLFNDYRVEPLDLFVPALSKAITGLGFYSWAGELNSLALDLEIDGTPSHLDSGGFVASGAAFPEIDIVISMHQMQECYDVVLHLVAAPATDSYPSLDVATTELNWTPATGATSYDVVCGSLDTLRSTVGDFTSAVDLCLASDLAATTTGYGLTPDEDTAFWFLVRDHAGSYDSAGASQIGSRDDALEGSPASCP